MASDYSWGTARLGHLLFNIFINDLLIVISNFDICNFADDNTLYSCEPSLDAVLTNLEIDLNKCLNWFRLNQLAVNPKKFQLMFLGVTNPNISLIINDQIIKCSEYVKLLGVFIDSKLTFNRHINNLCNKANMKINCLFRIRNFIGEKQAALLGNAYILSYFNYCPLIWMFYSKTLGKKINHVHKRCLKAIYRKYDFDLPDLLSELKLPTIHTKHIHFLLIEVFKSLNGLNPEFMSDFFQEKHLSFNLRKSRLLKLPDAKTTLYGTNSVNFQACLQWNNLPINIRNSGKVGSFRKQLSEKNLRCTCRLCKTT